MGIQAINGGGYGLVSLMSILSSRGNVLVYATDLESEAGKRKTITCPVVTHYDSRSFSTHLCLLEVEYAADASLDTSLKQGCQHVFLPCFSVCASALASWTPARGTCSIYVLFAFCSVFTVLQQQLQMPSRSSAMISEQCWFHRRGRLVASTLTGGFWCVGLRERVPLQPLSSLGLLSKAMPPPPCTTCLQK